MLTFFIGGPWGASAVAKQTLGLAHELVHRGHRVWYLPSGRSLRLAEGGVTVVSFPSPRPIRPVDFRFLHGLVRAQRPDCLISHFGADNVMSLVGWAHRVPCRINWYHTLSSAIRADSTQHVVTFHLQRLRKRGIYGLATDLVANSQAARRDLIATFGVSPAKTHVQFNSLQDLGNADRPSEADRRRRVLVCPGRFSKTKGQDVLIRALALLAAGQDPPTVRFIGEGETLSGCVALADQLGVRKLCEFSGALQHGQLLRDLASAAATVVPSRSDAFGLVNIESMSVGTPVVASAVGGIPEIVRDGIDGLLVPPDDPPALAAALQSLLGDERLRERMGHNARGRFLDTFEQSVIVRSQAEWLERLVRERRS